MPEYNDKHLDYLTNVLGLNYYDFWQFELVRDSIPVHHYKSDKIMSVISIIEQCIEIYTINVTPDNYYDGYDKYVQYIDKKILEYEVNTPEFFLLHLITLDIVNSLQSE